MRISILEESSKAIMYFVFRISGKKKKNGNDSYDRLFLRVRYLLPFGIRRFTLSGYRTFRPTRRPSVNPFRLRQCVFDHFKRVASCPIG